MPLRRRGVRGYHARHAAGGRRTHRRAHPPARRRLALPRRRREGTAEGDHAPRGSRFRVDGGKELLTVTISIGVAATLGEHDTPEALLKRADAAVYEAKAAGRNKVISKAA